MPIEEPAPLIRVVHSTGSAATVKDRVVQRLLSVGLLSRSQVYTAQLLASPSDTLWRIVADMDGVDRNAVMETAALAYGFEPVQVSLVGSIALMDRLALRLPVDAWAVMNELSVLPVIEDGPNPDLDGRPLFAADDPSSLGVRSMVSNWTKGVYRLGYLPKEAVARCLDEAARLLPHLFPEHRDSGALPLRRAA